MRDHDLSRARHHQTRVKGSVFTTTIWHRYHAVRQRVTQAASHVAFSSSQSAFERRLAAQDRRDPGQIRSGFVSSADESDHLPRQGRKNIRCRCDDAELEYNSEDRADSQQNVALPCWLSVPEPPPRETFRSPYSLGKRARFTVILVEEVFRRTRRVHRNDSPLRA